MREHREIGLFEVVEPFGLFPWPVLPTRPVRRAFVLTAAILLVVALVS